MARRTEKAMARLNDLADAVLAIYVKHDRQPTTELVGWVLRLNVGERRPSLWVVDDWRKDKIGRICTE